MSYQDELISKDIKAYLDKNENKTLLRFLTCGSVDDGKSTLIGRLLHDSKLVYEDQLAAIKSSAKNNKDNEEIDLALLVDGLQAEREQGITIDVAYRYFSTEKRKFIIADTPGHEQYTRNMVTGASNSDLAIILIDARKGVIRQTKRHSYIISLLELKNVVVAVNKMDLVEYKEEVFTKIKKEYQDFAKQINIKNIKFIPISALKGDNIVDKSDKMPWHKDDSLLSFLENLELEEEKIADGFQLPVQYVNRPNSDLRTYCGTINKGSIKANDPVIIMPSGLQTKIDKIITADGELETAYANMSISVTLKDDIDISRGDLLIHGEKSCSVTNQQKLRAHLVWIDNKPLLLNKEYAIKISTNSTNAKVDIIHHKIDINTLDHINTNSLELNEIGLLDIQLDKPLPVEQFSHNKELGAFILIDKITNATVAAGMISSQKAKMDSNKNFHLNIVDANKMLANKKAKEIIKWALAIKGKAIVTTNFGPQEAVILHMVSKINPNTEILWVDSGYNTKQTYIFADYLQKKLNLNLKVYTPLITVARRDSVMGGIPTVDSEKHKEFTQQFKLEPFLRAIKELKPDVWLTAVRREQTAVREKMNIVDIGPNNIIKVSPLLDWKIEDMKAYLKANNLKDESKYFDPTKVEAGRECGLHTIDKN